MDDYRGYLKNTSVVPIFALKGEDSQYKDEQIVSIAGIVQTVKLKMTRNNTQMAYVTIEDDTASMELILFSNVIGEYGGYVRENEPVVVTGKLSARDDKEPQIVVNRVRPMSDYADPGVRRMLEQERPRMLSGTLYLRLPTEEGKLYPKIRAIVNMFPGTDPVVLFFADTRLRRGTRCGLQQLMLDELKNVLGEGNVVLK